MNLSCLRMLEPATRDRLLRRIGLTRAPAGDAAGLRTLHRAFVSRVPYEALAVQLGEAGPLAPLDLVQRMLHGGRGGYCFEANTVLHALLEAVGFTVERREGNVGPRDAHARGEPTNHLALIAHTSRRWWCSARSTTESSRCGRVPSSSTDRGEPNGASSPTQGRLPMRCTRTLASTRTRWGPSA